jgi:hemolysin activation/secretion protein
MISLLIYELVFYMRYISDLNVCSYKNKKALKNILIGLVLLPVVAKAGLLEMPDTTEAPQFERKTLLLDLDIPGVKDRDPDPESGPHLNVKEFRVQGLTEFPEQGITREKIIAQVEAIRFDMMGEGRLLSSGYTLDELGKVSDLIAEIEEETKDQHVGPLEVQKLVFLIREQRRQRGITLGMIETVANTITRYYREHGFILAKAYIPKQQVRDGVVTLTVLLGELGEVDVKNNKRYSAKTIQHVFDDDLAKPVTNDGIEEKLFLVNDLPGLSVQGYFEPGTQVGDTKLNVNVTSEQWYDVTERVDNHGSDRSGKYRAYTEFLLHNPLNMADQLELGVLGTFAPQNATYGSLRYTLPILSPRVKFSVGASNNDFILDRNDVDLPSEGKSKVVDASVKYQMTRGRVKNHSVGLKISKIDSQIDINEVDTNFLDNSLQNLEIFYDFDLLNDAKRVLQQGNVTITSSHLKAGATEGQNKNPAILNVDYSRLSFINIPFTKTESKLILRFSGQYAGTRLASSNQFSIAGPTRARGFSVNEFYADDSAYLGADLVFKGPSLHDYKLAGESFSNLVQPFIFTDLTYGYNNRLDTFSAIDETLADVGVGFKFSYQENVRGNLVLALPVAASGSAFTDTKTPDKGVNIYFDFQIGF